MQQPPENKKDDYSLSWRSKRVKATVSVILVGLVLFYFVLPQIHVFGLNNRQEVPRQWGYVIIAASVFLLTFFLSAVSYKSLAFAKLKYFKTSLIQFASDPFHVMLPSGIGAMGFNYIYLRRNQHTRVKAGLVVTMNNLIGVAANSSMLLVLLLIFGLSSKEKRVYTFHSSWLFAGGVLLVIFGIVAAYLLSNHIAKLHNLKHELVLAIKQYRQRLPRLAIAFVSASGLSLITAFAFWFSLKAYGINLTYASSFVIYSFSVFIGSTIPTPGGLGGVEASLVAGLLAVHAASASLALAAVLAYRALSYWTPLIIGLIALALVKRFHLIRA